MPPTHEDIHAVPMSLSQWLLLLLLSVLWGGSFFFVGIAVRELPTFTLVLTRVGLAAALLLPLALALGHALPRTLAGWTPFAVMAVLNNLIPFSLIFHGQREVSSGLASVLNATTPLWSVLIAHVLTQDEKLDAKRIMGVLLGILGVGVLAGPEALFGRAANLLGMLAILAGAISYGLSGVWGRRLKGTPPIVTAACQLTCSTLLLLPVTALLDQPWTLPAPDWPTVAAVLALATLSTALAYIVFFHIMAVSGPSNVLLVTLLIPVTAILLGTTLLGEALLARQLAGALVIGAALLVIDGRLLGLARRKPGSAER